MRNSYNKDFHLFSESDVENPAPVIQTLAEQHARHSYAIKAREHTHHQVTHYEYHRLNEASRFHGTALEFLSPWSHSRSRQTGTTLLAMLSIALCVFLAADGISHLAHHIDEQYWSDGAPPSLSQQHKNYATAQTIAGSSSLGLTIAFIFSALLVYYFIDRVRYMRGYRDFTIPLKTPNYKNIHSKSFFNEVDDHAQFLMEQRFGLGLPAIADMLTSLQENLIDPEEEEEASVATNPLPTLPTPSASSASRASSNVQEQSLELSISPKAQKQLATHKAELHTVPAAPKVSEPSQTPRSHSDFLDHLALVEQKKAENMAKIQEQCEKGKQVIDQNQISIVVGNERLVRRVEELERIIQNLNLGDMHSVYAADADNNIIDRLNRLEAAALIPPQKLRSDVRPPLASLQQELNTLKENVLVDKHAFIPLLVFSIRQKMSLPGIRLTAENRAKFLKKLLIEPYYQTHPSQLSLILYVFFGFCRSHEEMFRSERNIDEKTFLRLSATEQTEVLTRLNHYGTSGTEIAENLLQTQALSKKAKTQLFRRLVKNGNNEGLTTRLLDQADNHLALRVDDQADFLHSVAHAS